MKVNKDQVNEYLLELEESRQMAIDILNNAVLDILNDDEFKKDFKKIKIFNSSSSES